MPPSRRNFAGYRSSDSSRSSSSRISIPYEPVVGRSGFSVRRASKTPGRSATSRKPRRLVEAQGVQVVVRGREPQGCRARVACRLNHALEQQGADPLPPRLDDDRHELTAIARHPIRGMTGDLIAVHGDDPWEVDRPDLLAVRDHEVGVPGSLDVGAEPIRRNGIAPDDLDRTVSPAARGGPSGRRRSRAPGSARRSAGGCPTATSHAPRTT